jgi:hypothetical protein
MIFNSQLTILHSTSQLLIILSITSFLYYGNYSINWYDIYSRVLGNEFYINLYYFLWTSFWYIPLLILLIVIWQFINYTSIKHIFLVFTLFILLFNTTADIHMYWVLNTNIYNLPLKSEHYNNLLLNSINKYHPGILYWTSLFIITYWLMFNLSYCIHIYKFYLVSIELIIKLKFIWFSLILLLTLGLGGWWALQEGSWGGWWNWDPSEVFGLLIFLFYLIYTHIKISKQGFINKWFYSLIFSLVLLQVYFFTQLNFDLVSHNFGTKIDNFIDNTNFYTTIIIISYISILRVWYVKLNLIQLLIASEVKFYLNSINLFKVYTLVILSLFFYELTYSLVPLFNDFLWKLLNINIANSILIFEKYNLEVVYLVLLFFWKYNKLLFMFAIYNIWSYWMLFVVYTVIPRKINLFIHWLVSLFMWVSLLTLSYIFTEWSLSLTPYLNTINICNTSITQILLNINNISLDYTQTQYLFGEFWFSWNTVWIDTTPEVYSFLYYFTKDLSTQLMIIGSKLFTFSININDILSVNLVYIFILSVILYLYSFHASKKIIF